MRKVAGFIFIAVLAAAPARAEEDCTTNVAGQTVCGADADVVRARREAEALLSSALADRPAGAPARFSPPTTATSASYSASSPAEREAPTPRARSIETISAASVAAAPPAGGGSVYSAYGQSVFLRGGYTLASSGGSAADGDNAPVFSGGYRRRILQAGRHSISIEGEIVYARDSDEVVLGALTIEATNRGLTALAALRWQYELAAGLYPFASAGVGAAHHKARLDDGAIAATEDEFSFGYSGRAGIEAVLTQTLSVEAAYRYLAATSDLAPTLHSAEIGLNYNF